MRQFERRIEQQNDQTRGIDALRTREDRGSASGNTRPNISRNLGGSINFSVTFVALSYDLLK